MPALTPPALVFGADVTALAVLRALGRQGVPVLAADTANSLIAGSRWYRRPPVGPIEESSPADRLAAFLSALPYEQAVLVPCTDEWALRLASLPPSPAQSYPATIAPLEVLEVLVDKQRFADAARQHAVPAPRTIPVTGPEVLDVLPNSELSKFFLKPTNSQLFARRFDVKGFPLADRRQAADLIRRIADTGLQTVLQEFIPGPPSHHVFVDGYVDRSRQLRAWLARRRVRMYPTDLGNSTLSVTVPMTEVTGAAESLRRLLDGLGYAGLFDAEFKYDARDGTFKILEVNARPWWQLALAAAAGIDLMTMAYRDALGLALRNPSGYRVGRTWVHPVPDARAWWSLRRSGRPTARLPVAAYFGAANAIFSWDDPMPGIREAARVSARALRGASGSRPTWAPTRSGGREKRR